MAALYASARSWMCWFAASASSGGSPNAASAAVPACSRQNRTRASSCWARWRRFSALRIHLHDRAGDQRGDLPGSPARELIRDQGLGGGGVLVVQDGGGLAADDTAYWLAGASPAWRDAVRVVAIDMCGIYPCAVRRMLPGAQIAVDLFHVVHLAVNMTGDVRRRVVRGKYGRRGRSGDPEYGIKNLLVRNLEHLSGVQFAKIVN